MSQVKVLGLLLIWFFRGGSSESPSQVLERIADQGFGKGFGTDNRDRMDTLILWGIADTSLAGLHQLPYPKVVFDSASEMDESVRAGCLVFMELKITARFSLLELLNNAFTGASKHYKAKYVILLPNDEYSLSNAAYIESFFDVVSIVDYVVFIYASELVGTIGYVRGSQFVHIRVGDAFDSLYDGRLKGLPFRVFFTQSVPYAYTTNGVTMSGVDVEIVQIIASKLGVKLTSTLFDSDLRAIHGALLERSADMYLTQRGCNTQATFPQIPLLHRSKMQLIMPRAHKINYNLQFLKPYQAEVWCFVTAVTAIAALLNWVFWERLRLSFLMVIIFGHGQQSTRLMALSVVALQILKFIMLEAYMGQVTSFMIRLRYQENPRTLEQFFASDTLLNEPPMMATFINQLPGDLPTRMRKKLIGQHVFNGSPYYEPGYAYIVNEYAAYVLRGEHKEFCWFNASFFYILNEPLDEVQMCYFFCMWSKFEGEFVEHLGQLYANGIVSKIMNDASVITRPATEMDPSAVLHFSDLVPVFLFVCYGWMLSVFSLTVEIAFQQITKRVRWIRYFAVRSIGFNLPKIGRAFTASRR